jgi:hypothetical protein
MLKTKNVLGCLLVFVIVMTPIMSVGAAAPAQTTTVDGTVQSCDTAIDSSTGDTIVVCVINLTGGGTQTIRLSVSDAVAKNLAIVEGDTVTIIATEGQEVSIDESMLLENPCVIPEDASQPISKILASYFCEDLGTNYDDVQTLHEAGFGFGEIAQACFMALKIKALNPEATGDLCSDILYAKQNNDYSNLPLPEGITVSNWGQLRKALLSHEKNSSNLGSVVSDGAKNKNEKGNNGKNNGHADEEHGKATK